MLIFSYRENVCFSTHAIQKYKHKASRIFVLMLYLKDLCYVPVLVL